MPIRKVMSAQNIALVDTHDRLACPDHAISATEQYFHTAWCSDEALQPELKLRVRVPR